jgi:hypothetical protein
MSTGILALLYIGAIAVVCGAWSMGFAMGRNLRGR